MRQHVVVGKHRNKEFDIVSLLYYKIHYLLFASTLVFAVATTIGNIRPNPRDSKVRGARVRGAIYRLQVTRHIYARGKYDNRNLPTEITTNLATRRTQPHAGISITKQFVVVCARTTNYPPSRLVIRGLTIKRKRWKTRKTNK